MKTSNLTPWCNLFSVESKYSISVYRSRHKQLLLSGIALIFLLSILANSTWRVDILVLLIIGNVLIFGFFIKDRRKKHLEFSFYLSNDGLLYLPISSEYHDVLPIKKAADSINNIAFVLEKGSRINCYALWLRFKPYQERELNNDEKCDSSSGQLARIKQNVNTLLSKPVLVFNCLHDQSKHATLVIYRDSLSDHDFSYLARIINKL